MDDNKFGLIAPSIVALGLVVVAVAIALRPVPMSQTPSVTVEGDVNPAPVVVSGVSRQESASVDNQADIFGGTTGLDTLNLKGSLKFNGTEVIGSSGNVSSSNFNVSGNVTGNLPSVYTATMSSSATTTACTFAPPEDGGNRSILAIWVEDTGSAASVGTVTWQAATGTTPYAITSTATKGLNTAITRSTALIQTTTSTPQLVSYIQQRAGEYFNFISSTTTNSGTCYVLAR